MHEADPERARRGADDRPRSADATNARTGAAGDGAGDDVPFAPDTDWVREQRNTLQYAGAGVQFGLTICLFALLGRWLDGRFDTSPWLLILGVLVGFGGGTYSLLKKVSRSTG